MARAPVIICLALLILSPLACKDEPKGETKLLDGVEYRIVRAPAEDANTVKVVVHRAVGDAKYAEGRLREGKWPYGEWVRYAPSGARTAYGVYPEGWRPVDKDGKAQIPTDLGCWDVAGNSRPPLDTVVLVAPHAIPDAGIFEDTVHRDFPACEPFPAELFWPADEVAKLPRLED